MGGADRHRAEAVQGAFGVVLGVERQGGLVL